MIVQGSQLSHPATLTLTVVAFDLKWLNFLLTYIQEKIQSYFVSSKVGLSPLTPDVRKVLTNFSAVWAFFGVNAGLGMSLVFVQAGFTEDSPTACHLVWTVSHKKADLTHQFVWWCVHKLTVIPTNCGSIRSHLLHLCVVKPVHAMMTACSTDVQQYYVLSSVGDKHSETQQLVTNLIQTHWYVSVWRVLFEHSCSKNFMRTGRFNLRASIS